MKILKKKKTRIICYFKTYLIMFKFCFYDSRTMNTLETHTLHSLDVSTILYVVILFFRSAASLFVFSLKQTLPSDTFSFFLSLHHSRPSCCLFYFWSNRRWEKGEKKREMFHLKILELIEWVPPDSNTHTHIYIYIYMYTYNRNKLCNWSLLFGYSCILYDCPKNQTCFVLFQFLPFLFYTYWFHLEE